MQRLNRHLYGILTIGLAALAVAGCGSAGVTVQSGGRDAQRSASLMLDFTPNAIHSGIYLAKQRGYDVHDGVDLQVRVPGESTDAIDLLTAHRVDFAILDIHDLAIADAADRNLVGVMAIVQRPLASVIAQSRFRTPKQLAGQLVGVTGDPSDLAVLHSVVAGAGGDPHAVRTITIGYDAVPDLVSGRVAAATAFWNDEGVQLASKRPGAFRVFRVEDYGAPPYPELVLCTTRSLADRDPTLVSGVVRALVRGYEGVLSDPEAGVRALMTQTTGLDETAVTAQLQAELPALRPVGGGGVGALEPSILERWSAWETRFGIVAHAPDVAKLFDRSFLPG